MTILSGCTSAMSAQEGGNDQQRQDTHGGVQDTMWNLWTGFPLRSRWHILCSGSSHSGSTWIHGSAFESTSVRWKWQPTVDQNAQAHTSYAQGLLRYKRVQETSRIR